MIGRMLGLGLGLAALGLSLGAAPVAAQGDAGLGRVLDSLTVLWQRGDAHGVVELVAPTGLDLDVHGMAVGPVSGRRAAAELRRVFDLGQTVSVRATRHSLVAGTADRAFVELTWVVRAEGAPVSERNTIFIGLERRGTDWKISQIRILP